MTYPKKSFKVKRSSAGLGLFAEREFTRGDELIEYTGEKISGDEADRRGGRYIFDIEGDYALDAKERKHLARYINHSCKPNCYAEIETDENRVFIIAKRKIEKGEEITYHYGKEYWEDLIGSDGCRCTACLESSLKK